MSCSIRWQKPFLLLIFALVFGVLSLYACAAERNPLAFLLPKTATAPVIDGVINEVEWQNALAISGVANSRGDDDGYSVRQVTYWLCWDEQHLYVAMRSPMLPGEKLRQAVRGMTVWFDSLLFDDTFDLYLHPKSYGQPGYAVYQLVIDSANRAMQKKYFQTERGSFSGQNHPDWTKDCAMANHVTPDGKYWESEVALNSASFALKQPLKDGDVWSILLVRNFTTPNWSRVTLPKAGNDNIFIPTGYPQFTLASNIPVVKCVDFGDILHGHLAPSIIISNPTASTARVHCTLSVLKGMTEIGNAQADVSLSPGEQQKPELTLDVPGAAKGDKYTADLLITRDGTSLYHDWVSFEIEPKALFAVTSPLPVGDFRFTGTYNPVRNLLGYTLDIIDMPQKTRYAYAMVTVRNGVGVVVASGRVAKMIEDQAKATLALPVLPVGPYSAETKLFAADGSVLGTQSIAFTRLDEAKEFPWYHNDIGITEECFFPFTPMTVKSDVVTCWNRAVTFDGMALPRSIVAGGAELLTDGIALYGDFQGKSLKCQPTQKLQVTKAKTGRVEMVGGGALVNLAVQTKTYMELDGFTLMSLTLTPKGKVALDKLYIDIPLSAQQTRLLYVTGANTETYTAQVAAQPGTMWTSMDMKVRWMTRGNFIPQIWQGNHQRGLCWFADDDRGWEPEDNKPALQVMRTGNTVTLRMNLISSPYTIDKPRTITFGVMASPMKPTIRGARLTEIDFGDTFGAVGMDGDNWSSVIPNKPYEASKEQVDAKMKRWPYLDALAKVNPCICAGGWGSVCTTDTKTLEYFKSEMADALTTRTAQDHYVYYLREWERKAGISGIYHDCSSPSIYRNLDNESAYTLPDGAIQPGWNLTLDRQFLKRLWVSFMQDGKMPPDIRANGGPAIITSYPFISNLNTGECPLYVTESSDYDFMDMSPAEYMQVFNPDTWGMNVSWMGVNGNWIKVDDATAAGREARRHHVAVLDGCSFLVGITRINDGSQNSTTQFARWGMGKTDVAFHPYWEPMNFAKCETPNMKMSAWTRPNKALFVVVNTAHSDGTAVLNLDYKKMGLWPKPFQEYLDVYNLSTGRAIPFDAFSGKVTVSVQGREYMLVAVEKY